MPKEPTKESWEKGFLNKFIRTDGLMNKYHSDKNGDTDTTGNQIKIFIRTLLSTQKAEIEREIVEEIEKRKQESAKYFMTSHFVSALDESIEIVKKVCNNK